MTAIVDIVAREILDSRGKPTLEVDVVLEDGSMGRAGVPAGASTGAHEAVELRDGDKSRYGGKGVLKAVESVNRDIFDAISGFEAEEQLKIDETMIALDGTPNKARLGANAILGVSLAVAKAGAEASGLPLYRYVGGASARVLPVPMMNVLNGGVHADNAIDFQEFMILPRRRAFAARGGALGRRSLPRAEERAEEGRPNTNVGDEGGFAPNLPSAEAALDFCRQGDRGGRLQARPGHRARRSIAPPREFFKRRRLRLFRRGQDPLDRRAGPTISPSSPTPIPSSRSRTAWPRTIGRLGAADRDARRQAPARRRRPVRHQRRRASRAGSSEGIANSILIKVNQIGTLTETLAAVDMAHRAGYAAIMSHRSGETEDSTIADLAVATNCGQIKTGSLARSDRLAKYNQLIRIEEELGEQARYAGRAAIKAI